MPALTLRDRLRAQLADLKMPGPWKPSTISSAAPTVASSRPAHPDG